MAYATNADVATYLNRSLTSPQQTQCDFYLGAATAWIDSYTGKKWGVASPVIETHVINGQFIWLLHTPVVAVSSLVVRDTTPGLQGIALVSTEGYELIDADKGLISLATIYNAGADYAQYLGYMATITYTHSDDVVPDNIKLAAILMAASKMNASLNPMQQRIRSFSDNRAVSVTFRDQEISAEIKELLPNKQVFIV